MLDVIGMMAQRDRIIGVLWLCPVLSVLLLSARSCVSVLASVSLSSLDAFCGFCGLAYAWRCLPLPCFRISARMCLPCLRALASCLPSCVALDGVPCSFVFCLGYPFSEPSDDWYRHGVACRLVPLAVWAFGAPSSHVPPEHRGVPIVVCRERSVEQDASDPVCVLSREVRPVVWEALQPFRLYRHEASHDVRHAFAGVLCAVCVIGCRPRVWHEQDGRVLVLPCDERR